jgi:hypothetical protein
MNTDNTLIYEINNVIISQSDKNILIEINSKSDIISIYVIMKFFSLNEDIQALYMIDIDEKGTQTFSKENQYKLQDLSLNNFLHYFSTKAILKENSSGFNGDSDSKKIIGWRFLFSHEFNWDKRDTFFIEKKIKEYRESKFERKKYN